MKIHPLAVLGRAAPAIRAGDMFDGGVHPDLLCGNKTRSRLCTPRKASGHLALAQSRRNRGRSCSQSSFQKIQGVSDEALPVDVDLCAPVARIVEIEPDQGTAFVAHDEASGKNCRARCGVPFSRFRMRASASDLIVLSHRSLRPRLRFI